MAPPPPPPPPPPPLPPSLSSTLNSNGSDRPTFLHQIQIFNKDGLKPTVTNDRSGPSISGSNNNKTSRNVLTNQSRTIIQNPPGMFKLPDFDVSVLKSRKSSVPQIPPLPFNHPIVKVSSTDQTRNGAPRLPPREPPPPPPSIETKPKLVQPMTDSQQRITRAPPPPPPPPYSSNVSDNIPKFVKQINPNGPPPPPPPPRGVVPSTNNITIRRPSSDFVDHSSSDRRFDQMNNADLKYDQTFEARFNFTPVERLPMPERWQQPLVHSRSSKNHVNVR